MKKIAIIGGGASGFFLANCLAEHNFEITILEKTTKTLAKVKVSGGGRCNVTHNEFLPTKLIKQYPRGSKKLKSPFTVFGPKETIDWFAHKGVHLVAEEDGRIFPESNTSQTIVDCLRSVLQKQNVSLITGSKIKSITKEKTWVVKTDDNKINADILIIATGADRQMFEIIDQQLQHSIIPPVPSLFTFNISDSRINGLPGISFSDVTVKLIGSKLSENGPLLITHKGLSGPAILKLSARGALELAELNYSFKILINFLAGIKEGELRATINTHKEENKNKKIVSSVAMGLPKRFWESICKYCEIEPDRIWNEIPKKQFNKLINELTQGAYSVESKSTFKDEFVTAGGVDLQEIDLKTFKSTKQDKLYFVGEVLNIDALTGGYNFQACWTGAYLAAQDIIHNTKKSRSTLLRPST